jgi:hypothetical protein
MSKNTWERQAGESGASAHGTRGSSRGRLARALHGARQCIGSVRLAPTRAFRTFFVTLGAAATVVAEKALARGAQSAN